MESDAHRLLKEAALAWAVEEGYRAVATEVRLPNSPFRADVAGCRMERPGPGELRIESTIAFECKQERSDFLKDSFREDGSVERLKLLHRRREKLEKLIGFHYPGLRKGDSLFPEFESSNPGEIGHEGYRRLVREIATIERGIFARTKFDRMIRYSCVDLCYLVIRRGIAEAHEIPSGWGLLECEFGEDDEEAEVTVLKKPGWNGATECHRLELLHRLALRLR